MPRTTIKLCQGKMVDTTIDTLLKEWLVNSHMLNQFFIEGKYRKMLANIIIEHLKEDWDTIIIITMMKMMDR